MALCIITDKICAISDPYSLITVHSFFKPVQSFGESLPKSLQYCLLEKVVNNKLARSCHFGVNRMKIWQILQPDSKSVWNDFMEQYIFQSKNTLETAR